MSKNILQKYKSTVSNGGRNVARQDSSKISIMQQNLSPVYNSLDFNKIGNTNSNSNRPSLKSDFRNSTIKKPTNLLPIDSVRYEGDVDADGDVQSQVIKSNNIREGFLKVKLKGIIQRMAKYTTSRMYKNLTFQQLKMIDDKAYDSIEYLGQKSGFIRKSNNSQQRVFRKQNCLISFIKKLDQQIPVLQPKHRLKTISDLLSLFAVVYIFFIISITISFHETIDYIVPSMSIYLCIIFLFLNVIVTLNTGYQKLGNTFQDRQHIFQSYCKNNLFTDLIGFISILILLIIDKNGNKFSQNYPDLYSFVKLIFFIPFSIKFKDFGQLIQKLEEKIMFKQKMQHIVQIVRLFSLIIMINHILACIWIFNAQIKNNENINWITSKNVQNETWIYQYVMSFYFCTVTMTTVGYGDITAKNFSEYILSILMMLTSSGVFGFSLNQIGTIFTDFYSQDKERKKKLNIINLHMEKKNVNQNLRSQIREYLEYVWQENDEKFQNDSASIISQLNEDLKKELYLHQNRRIINYLEQHFTNEFIQKAILLIQEQKCKPQQKIQTSSDDLSLYLIEKGQVEMYITPNTNQYTTKSIQILQEGQMFGISEFYTGECRDIFAKAIGFVNLIKISRNDFIKSLQEFPRDMEMFNYLKDRRIFNKDFAKIGETCISCDSNEHVVTNCNYLHFVPYRSKVITRHNFELPFDNKRKKSWNQGQIVEKKRRGYKTTREIVQLDDQRYELFAYEFFGMLDDYEQKFLCYNFNYNYTSPYLAFSDDDEDEEEGEVQNGSALLHSGNNINHQINYQTSCLKERSNSFVTNHNNHSSTPINNQQFYTQRLSTFEKVPSINGDTAVNTPPILTTNLNGKSSTNISTNPPQINLSQSRNLDQSPINRRKSMLKQLTPLIVTTQATNFENFIQLTEQKPQRVIYTRNSKKIKTSQQIQQAVNSPVKESNFHNPQQIYQNNSKEINKTSDSLDHQKSIEVQRQLSHTNDHHFNSQNSLKHQVSNQQISNQLMQFQRSIMQNLKTIIRTSNVQNTITKTNVTEEQNHHFGMIQIFQSFDKQKDFQVYYPLNNLSFILYNLKNKKQLTRNQYLTLIQNASKSKNQITSYNSLLKAKIEVINGSKKEQTMKKAFTLKHLSFHSNLQNTASFDNYSQIKEIQNSQKNQSNNNNNSNLNFNSNINLNSNNNISNYKKSVYSNKHIPLPDQPIQVPDMLIPIWSSERQIQTARSPTIRSKINGQDLILNKTELSISDTDYIRNMSLQSPNVQEEVNENSQTNMKILVKNFNTVKNSEYFIKE
ncbi:cation channel family protein (macronuclear) [Tetrahymena thermophila SB210]|uniref:Cation channel family protein n=1 Tax=Tetrahymena thermophila (strain SB210) TaxID=312017 RepID=Q22XT9_TETTS|nr:cation channel family protein [Tetrahymena thermophila SB210]EAR90082.2 cation channel family protein [Tetrahymena thermophila SB210]|eukprot:XP_001010327.2 cation channel family protein [Tetrahymena thermophila SB210]